jgi:flagellar biosynthesis GTPase FlhF
MMLACVFSAAAFASGLAGPSLILALSTPTQANEPDSSPASAIEQALAERGCTGALGEAAGYDAHGQCLGARLLTIRSDFGKDLNKLSPPERKKLDATCSRLLTARGREEYLDCLHAQLASLPARPGRDSRSVLAEEPLAVGAVAIPPAPASLTVMSASFVSSYPLQSASALLITIAGSAGVVFFVKSRRGRHTCRACAVRVEGAGDLCTNCRHDAAEVLRHAAAERAAVKQAHEDDKRREGEQAEEQRQQKVRAEEEARRRQLEEARRSEHEARLREEDRQEREEFDRQAEESQRAQAAARDDAAFDPFAVLGVARGSSEEAIRNAFEIAKLTYDPEEVSHLGADAQDHFAAKLRTAERAYHMLAGEVDAPAESTSRDQPQPAENLAIGELVS